MKKVYDFLKESGVFYIATVDGDKPRVRPFGAVAEFEGRLYIVTNNRKDVYKQIKINPNIEISSMTKDGKWIRLSAQAVRDDRAEARKASLDENPELRRMYDENDGIYEVMYLKNAEAAICSFTEAPEIIRF